MVSRINFFASLCYALIFIALICCFNESNKASADDGFYPVNKSIALMNGRIEKNPKDFVAHILLGKLLVKRAGQNDDFSDFVEAEKKYRTALELIPKHPETKTLLAECLMKQHRFSEAQKLAEEVLKVKSSSISAISTLGDAFLETGQYESAKVQFDKLKKMEPDAPPILARLARWHELNGSNQKAIELLEKALKVAIDYGFLESQIAWYHERLGTLYTEAGNHNKAFESFEKAHKIDKNSYQVHFGRGTVWLYENDFGKSLEALSKAVKVRPNPVVYALISKVNLLKGDKTASKAAKEKALQILKEESEDERSAKAHIREPILIYADLGINLEQAEKFAKNDLKVRPDIFSEMALAWVLYKQIKFGDAKIHAEKAVATKSENLDLNYKAGLIFYASGDVKLAQKHFAIVLKNNPKFSVPRGEKPLDFYLKKWKKKESKAPAKIE